MAKASAGMSRFCLLLAGGVDLAYEIFQFLEGLLGGCLVQLEFFCDSLGALADGKQVWRALDLASNFLLYALQQVEYFDRVGLVFSGDLVKGALVDPIDVQGLADNAAVPVPLH